MGLAKLTTQRMGYMKRPTHIHGSVLEQGTWGMCLHGGRYLPLEQKYAAVYGRVYRDLDAHPNKTNLVGIGVAAAQHCSFKRKTRSTKPEPMVRMSATLYQIIHFMNHQGIVIGMIMCAMLTWEFISKNI